VVWRCDYVHLASPGLALLLPSPASLSAAHSAPPAAPGNRAGPAAAGKGEDLVDGVFAVLPGPGGGGGRGHPRLYSCRQREVLVKALVAEGKSKLGVTISGEPGWWPPTLPWNGRHMSWVPRTSRNSSPAVAPWQCAVATATCALFDSQQTTHAPLLTATCLITSCFTPPACLTPPPSLPCCTVETRAQVTAQQLLSQWSAAQESGTASSASAPSAYTSTSNSAGPLQDAAAAAQARGDTPLGQWEVEALLPRAEVLPGQLAAAAPQVGGTPTRVFVFASVVVVEPFRGCKGHCGWARVCAAVCSHDCLRQGKKMSCRTRQDEPLSLCVCSAVCCVYEMSVAQLRSWPGLCCFEWTQAEADHACAVLWCAGVRAALDAGATGGSTHAERACR
jgi:hypothetical protein